MSWIRSSPLRQSLNRGRPQANSLTDFDEKAVVDSFCQHWQQAYGIITRSEVSKQAQHDDVLGVVNHLDHMVTLMLVELHNSNKVSLPNNQQPAACPCLEYLLSENLLDKLYEWSLKTGRYSNAVRLEQLKLYELLVSHSRHQLLVHEPFLRPLLKLLASCQNEIFPHDVGKRLVLLLNQLCVILMQNVHLLDLFFFTSEQTTSAAITGINNAGQTNFIIFSLLIPYVHCEGSIGHQARDALLLCMSLSQKNANVGTYIAHHSSMCPVLVTGLCGLYSSLPNTIEIMTVDWYRITADDVNDMPELTLFMNSLEFCNAVVQVAHTLIREQLLDFMLQGFLVPVLGPALLQKFKGSVLQTNVESQISAMVYLDLILRTVTDPGLLNIMVKFLLDNEKFDEQRIIDVLVDRINSPDSRLCMVTLSLFDTLLNLKNEDIMNELILKYVQNAPHIPISQRHKINNIQCYTKTVDYFLDLVPEVMKNSNKISNENNSLDYLAQSQQLVPQSSGPMSMPQSTNVSKTIGANWNHYGLHTGDTLYSNYHAYLFDAHQKIKQCKLACDRWKSSYYYKPMNTVKDNKRMPNEHLVQMIKCFLTEFPVDSGSNSVVDEHTTNGNKMDSLQSIGESSGYESFKYRPEDDEEQPSTSEQKSDNSFNSNLTIVKTNVQPWRVSNYKEEQIIELDFSEDLFTQGTVSLGPFMTSIWNKLQTFTSNCLYVNLHLTGLIAHICYYPLPLVHSILLRPEIPTTSDIPSFYQVLKILKQQIDAELPMNEESLELIDIGRTFLIDRELKIINARKIAVEALKVSNKSATLGAQPVSNSGTQQVSIYDPFKRQERRKTTLGNTITNMFRRPSGQAQGITNSIQLREQSSQSLELQQQQNLQDANSSLYVNERQRDLAIAAVLLDEWLKELSAISQEQSIVMLNDNFIKTYS